jgi:hypothetical protein
MCGRGLEQLKVRAGCFSPPKLYCIVSEKGKGLCITDVDRVSSTLHVQASKQACLYNLAGSYDMSARAFKKLRLQAAPGRDGIAVRALRAYTFWPLV